MYGSSHGQLILDQRVWSFSSPSSVVYLLFSRPRGDPCPCICPLPLLFIPLLFRVQLPMAHRCSWLLTPWPFYMQLPMAHRCHWLFIPRPIWVQQSMAHRYQLPIVHCPWWSIALCGGYNCPLSIAHGPWACSLVSVVLVATFARCPRLKFSFANSSVRGHLVSTLFLSFGSSFGRLLSFLPSCHRILGSQ